MRATEIIRDLLDLIDNIDAGVEVEKPQAISADVAIAGQPADINHFKQIIDLVQEPEVDPTFANEPNEQYASIDAVTTNAGGGVNGPKQAADLRGNSFRIYPGERN